MDEEVYLQISQMAADLKFFSSLLHL